MSGVQQRDANLHRLLTDNKIATLEELKAAFGTAATMTVFRSLTRLGYLSSYSHRGRFYTLAEIPDFDPLGLWNWRSARFSRYGNLLETTSRLVERSESGYTALELERVLQVEVKHALLQLVRRGSLSRTRLEGRFVYLSGEAAETALRRSGSGQNGARRRPPDRPASQSDPPNRRQGASPTAERFGGAGPGAKSGRRTKADRKKTPQVIQQIRRLLEPDTAGDPISGSKWTHQTAPKIARRLGETLQLKVSATVVRRLLKDLDYSLKSNRKCLSAGNSPHRDAQFAVIQRLRRHFAESGDPVISVDSKKKELIGLFKNPGKTWWRQAKLVQDHNFRSQAEGIACPYGIYDVGRNFGLLVVGQSADTPAFAVNSILTWWLQQGRHHYR